MLPRSNGSCCRRCASWVNEPSLAPPRFFSVKTQCSLVTNKAIPQRRRQMILRVQHWNPIQSDRYSINHSSYRITHSPSVSGRFCVTQLLWIGILGCARPYASVQVLYTLQLKMAQYRARAKAGWEASASAKAEQGADKMAGTGGAGAGDDQSSENAQTLAAREIENQVHVNILRSHARFLCVPQLYCLGNVSS